MTLDTKTRTDTRKLVNKEELSGLKLYTLSELEPILGVTHRTLQQYIKSGKLKGIKLGGKWRITDSNLLKFLNGDS